MESGIQLKGSGMPLTIGVGNQVRLAKNPGIEYLESRIQDCLGFPYIGRTERIVEHNIDGYFLAGT